jgi:hypothetical protein
MSWQQVMAEAATRTPKGLHWMMVDAMLVILAAAENQKGLDVGHRPTARITN